MRRKVYISREQKALDFALGFGGWYLINGLAWLVIGYEYGWFEGTYGIPNLLLFPLNILLLVIFAIFRRWIGMGLLSAIAINLVIALVIGASMNAICAIPFWLPE